MSAQTLSPAAAPAAGGPADAIAAAQRVQQLQTLIAQAKQGGSTASFAAALDAASGRAGNASAAGLPTAAAPTGNASTVGLSTAGVPTAGFPTAGAPATAALIAGSPATAAPAPAGSSASTPYDGAIAQAAARYNLDPAVLHGLIQQESGFDPNSRSSAGALGLTQLMPGTASSLGVANPLDPVQSIEGGARYLSQMLSQFGGNTEAALAAYNAGPGAVRQYGGVPPYAETQDYVKKVLGYANTYRQSLAATGAPASASVSAPTGSIA